MRLNQTSIRIVTVALLWLLTLTCSAVELPVEESPDLDIGHTIALQRATQIAIWGLPAVSIHSFLTSMRRDIQADYGDIIYFSEPMESRHGFLTPNNQVPYVILALTTKNGPVVIDVPPASEKAFFFGSLLDAWQLPVVDIGPAGDNTGKGGKYLFLPPGFDGPVPEGYLTYRPSTFNLYLGLRPIAANNSSLEEVVAYSKQLKSYPLALAGNIPENRYIDAYPQTWNTQPSFDLSYFQAFAEVINDEPVQLRDLAIMGMLETIGIEKGQPFNPDTATQAILRAALELAYAHMQSTFTTPGNALVPYWKDLQWQLFNFPKEQVAAGVPFVTEEALLLDARSGGAYFWVTFIPKKLGGGTFYLTALRDHEANLFDGDSRYRLRIPKDIPVRDFWSVIVYSMKTKGFINGADKIGFSSQDEEELQYNDDGSVDIYFGGTAPEGLMFNWLPTGEDFFLLFRLYGPETPLFNKTWVLNDVEKMN